MDDEKVKKLIDELDGAVSKDGALVQFDMYGGGPDEGFIQANKQGFLRLGIEFIKAAYSPKIGDKKNKHSDQIEADIQYLTTEESEIRFDWFERKEDIVPPEPAVKPGGFKDAVQLLGCSTVLFVVLFVLIVGVVTIFSWFN